MKGDKFTLVASDIKTWYDGKTQWVYVEPANEVNISSPAGEDLQLTNPAILLRDYRMGYVSRYTGEATGANGKSIQNVELQPKNKSDITKITLQIEKTSSLPIHIQLEMKNGNRSVIQISNIRTGVNRPDDYFTFRQSNYPGVETIDLR
jgi:outer membrane lipoprotein-sorting protein